METRTPRLEKAEDAVQAILAAATQELIEEGIDAVTHRKVAALAKANVRSTTYYFKSVKALRREALKLAFGINAKQREAVLGQLASKTRADVVDIIVLLSYGNNLSTERLAVTQKNILTASLEPEYADLMQQVQREVEAHVQQVLDHFGLKLEASRAIALVDGRVFEHVLSGGKTDFKAKLASDFGI